VRVCIVDADEFRFQVHDGFKLLQGMDLHHYVQSQPGSHAVQLRQILCRQGGRHQVDGIRSRDDGLADHGGMNEHVARHDGNGTDSGNSGNHVP